MISYNRRKVISLIFKDPVIFCIDVTVDQPTHPALRTWGSQQCIESSLKHFEVKKEIFSQKVCLCAQCVLIGLRRLTAAELGGLCIPARVSFALRLFILRMELKSRQCVCNIPTHGHVFLPLCRSLMPAEAWCIQSSPERASPCRGDGQIQPLGARWAPAYCRASSRAPGPFPSASCSPGSTQLMWPLPSLHRCSLHPPPPPPVLLLHPSPLPAPCQAS